MGSQKILVSQGDEELYFNPSDGDLRVAIPMGKGTWYRQHGYVQEGDLYCGSQFEGVPTLGLSCRGCPKRDDCLEQFGDKEDAEDENWDMSEHCSHYDSEQTRAFLSDVWERMTEEEREEALYGPNAFCE